MSTHFTIEAWRAREDGSLVPLEGDEGRFSVNNSLVFSLVDAIEERRWREGRALFPWYHRAYDPYRGKPTPEDCFEPRDVLRSIRSTERELARNSEKYPFKWVLWYTQPDGSRQSLNRLRVTYDNKPCLLYANEKGCWAKILAPGDAYEPHYDLSEHPAVTVDCQGLEMNLQIERASLLTRRQPVLDGMRRVCLWARRHDALVLTMILH